MAGNTKAISTTNAVDSKIIAQADVILDEAEKMGDDELKTMINDVIKRLSEGEEIPTYLKKAIGSHVDESHALYPQITAFLSLI